MDVDHMGHRGLDLGNYQVVSTQTVNCDSGECIWDKISQKEMPKAPLVLQSRFSGRWPCCRCA